MQTKEDIVKVWYPEARIINHPCSGIIIAYPHSGSKSYYWLSSKCFPEYTPDEVLWEDAYWNLISRAKILLEFSQSFRGLFEG